MAAGEISMAGVEASVMHKTFYER